MLNFVTICGQPPALVGDGERFVSLSHFIVHMNILNILHQMGRQAGPVLSQQVKALIGEGNQAYVDSDIPATIRIMQEVIRIEPHAASAWSVLAQCYSDLKEPKKELQLRIMAAHLRHDAEEWERLAGHSR